ncbi:unnamed protein product, partial [Rotaria magnacalcarata]
HAYFEGKGVVVSDTKNSTIRYDDYQLEHFIEFIVSPHICTDLPFGEKERHLSTGETLLIPSTIRNLAPQRIITQYYNYCKEHYGDTFHPLGRSSLFSILNECSASTRRSLQGLDSFSAEGSTAFDILFSIVDGLSIIGLTPSDAGELKRDLQNSRNYLKSDYKVHISSDSPVPDHCSAFALSDTVNKCWQHSCDHDHDKKCDRCELLETALCKIRAFIEQYQTDAGLRDRLIYRVQQQVQYIEEWKAHLLRTVHQDQARIDILNDLDNETVMIHVDWAMKWLPVKYRESTANHFAKRGLSWHIAYVIRKQSSMSSTVCNSSPNSEEIGMKYSSNRQIFQHKIFCHVFDQCVQNAKTVTSILRHIFLRLQQTTPDLKYVHLRSDNAGCYHSAEALLSIETLFKETGIWIKSIDFCDPQSGKGPCDRIAAVIKCSIRRFINEKNNCTNAIEFLMAAEQTNGIEFYASEIPNPHMEKVEWKGVKQINNIKYSQGDTTSTKTPGGEICVWHSWKVGSGKIYRWSDFGTTVQKISPLNVFFSKNVSAPWITDSFEKADKSDSNDFQHDESSTSEEESSINETLENDQYSFDYLTNGCTARYRYHANLLRHYTTGKHKMKLEKQSLVDKSKVLFHQSLTTNHLRSTPLMSITVVSPENTSTISSLNQNWASQKSKPNVRFNDKQKQFLQGKFDEGTKTGMKWDPARVALDMEMLTSNGSYVFNNDECLTQGQIKSYFSRLALKQRSGQQTSNLTIAGNIKLNDTSIIDASNDNEETDDRELEVYSWRHVVDEARNILDGSSPFSALSSHSPLSNSVSVTNSSSSRKSTMDA